MKRETEIMKVTQKMIEQADAAYDRRAMVAGTVDRCYTICIEAALTAALADVPEPGAKEPGPFVLSAGEGVAMRCNPFECTAMHVKVLQDALDRAVRTLAPVQEPGPFVLSEEEQYALRSCFEHCEEGMYVYVETARGALDRACRTLGPVQEPGPFVLSRLEKIALHDQVVCAGAQGTLQKALDRACRTLGPQAVPAPTGDVTDADVERAMAEFAETEPGDEDAETLAMRRALEGFAKRRPAPTGDVLTAEEREHVESVVRVNPLLRNTWALAIIDRLAPKPKPVEKTNEELARELREGDQGGDSWNEKLDLLVRRANQGAGK